MFCYIPSRVNTTRDAIKMNILKNYGKVFKFCKLKSLMVAGAYILTLSMPLTFSATTAADPPSLTNNQVVYYSSSSTNKGLYKSNVDGTNSVAILSSSDLSNANIGSASLPLRSIQISPDRSKVYFMAAPSSTSTYVWYSVNIDGTNLTSLPNLALGARFSPDFTKIVTNGPSYYDTINHKTNSSIKILNADGSNPITISPPMGKSGQIQNFVWVDRDTVAFRYISDVSDASGCNVGIARINIDGTDFTKVTPDQSVSSVNDCDSYLKASINPLDGSYALEVSERVLFVNGTQGSRYSIWRMNADGTGLQRLADAPTSSYSTGYTDTPSWSPSGQKIGYKYLDLADGSQGCRIAQIDVATGVVSQSGIVGCFSEFQWESLGP